MKQTGNGMDPKSRFMLFQATQLIDLLEEIHIAYSML